MTKQEQIKALAELSCCSDYLTSYDAIIPLIQKQDWKIRNKIECKLLDNIGSVVESTPAQLCEALLRSVGKWKD